MGNTLNSGVLNLGDMMFWHILGVFKKTARRHQRALLFHEAVPKKR